jgi:hypothetical protein
MYRDGNFAPPGRLLLASFFVMAIFDFRYP